MPAGELTSCERDLSRIVTLRELTARVLAVEVTRAFLAGDRVLFDDALGAMVNVAIEPIRKRRA